MPIDFTCDTCGKLYQVNDNLAGRQAKCKQCGGIIHIPHTVDDLEFEPQPINKPSSSSSHEPPNLFPAAESTPPPPRRQTPPRKRSSWSTNPPAAARSASAGLFSGLGIGCGVLILLSVLSSFLFRAARVITLPPQIVPAPLPPGNFPSVTSSKVSSPAVVAAQFPPRGEGEKIAPGVRCIELQASGPPNLPITSMKLWLYLPEGKIGPRSLPCVFIAPAGSIIITGMDLADGDRAEHIPWVKAGYAVVAYSLDGPLPEGREDDAAIRQASDKFVAARAGLLNAQAAINWTLKNAPEIDPTRLFTAGHSSAGTMALLLAENDARLKACAAFAPRSNTQLNFPDDVMRTNLARVVPSVSQIFSIYNPSQHVASIKCPVLLFHAQDDPVVPKSETVAFERSIKPLGKSVTLKLVPAGGHYDPMIEDGIPAAMEFFQQHGSQAKPRP